MITIPKAVYEKFLRFALENANPHDRSRAWKECIGLILGRIIGTEIFVTDIIPMATGNAVYVDITDYEKVFSLVPLSKIESGEVIVGWAHTHPGLGLFFSGTDIRTQYTYQQMHPLAFGLVLDPMTVTTDFAGFNIYRVDPTGSSAIPTKYIFESDFDFTTTRSRLITELYEAPPIPTTPLAHSATEIEWKNVKIYIDGPSRVPIYKQYSAKIMISLPTRQYLRFEYRITMINMTPDRLFSNGHDIKKIYHETISSGSLAVFSLYSKSTGPAHLKIENLTLIDYQLHHQKMPDLILTLKILDE